MTQIVAEQRDGEVRIIATGAAATLMEALRDAGCGVAGTCGGAMSCGTCHIYVDSADLGRLPPASEDERDMLDALADVVAVTDGSRLACQLQPGAALAGLRVTIAPQP